MEKGFNLTESIKNYVTFPLLLGTQGSPSESENRITIFINFLAIFSIIGVSSTYFQLKSWGVKESTYLFFYFCIPLFAVTILSMNYKKKYLLARIVGSFLLNLTAWNALIFFGKSFNGYLIFYVAIIYNVMAIGNRSKYFWVLLALPILGLLYADYLSYTQLLPITHFHSSEAPLPILLSDTIITISLILTMLLIEKLLSEKNERALKSLNQNLESIVEKRTELLNIAKSEALQASEAKSQFVANTSHELRTPLGAIIGFIDLISNDQASDIEKKQYVEVIKRNANQLLQIVNEVLDLSKIEADKLQIEKQNINLHDLMEDIRLLMSLKSEDKGLEFKIIKSEPLPQIIETDPLRLKQILINLIGNAIKFTEAGSITVHLKCETKAHKNYLVFNISDTGLGISPKYIKDLFKPFSQEDSSYMRKYGGTGLGLSLSKKMAHLLGGELTLLETNQNTGSTFQLRIKCVIPQVSQNKSEANSRLVSNAKNLKDQNILIVDDAPDNLFLISRYLKNEEANVDTAINGQDALEKVRTQKYDVILMDLQMPIMDGYQAVRIMKEDPSFKTPIIAFTADAMKGEKWRSQAAGFSGYLTKPVDRQKLIKTIAELIATRNS